MDNQTNEYHPKIMIFQKNPPKQFSCCNMAICLPRSVFYYLLKKIEVYFKSLTAFH